MAAKSTLTTPYDFDRVITDVLGLPAPRRPIFEAPTVVLQPPPLSEATVGLLVTSGAYFPDQQRLGETEDLSFRLLSRDRGLEGVLFAHMTPIRAFALADPNVAYPLDRMLELESAGVIGKLADYAISMVGSVANYEGLALETAGNVVAECESMGVDLLLVLPFCPQCHMSAGVLARAIEQRGVPTTSITTLLKTTLAVKPPRPSFLDFPLGCTAGRPFNPQVQRQILTAALTNATSTPGSPWEINHLPFSWGEPPEQWHALVDDLYRIDNAIRGTVASRGKAHAGTRSIVGNESEFVIRCAC
jgi:D-proline reductase (dithiol) PrdB